MKSLVSLCCLCLLVGCGTEYGDVSNEASNVEWSRSPSGTANLSEKTVPDGTEDRTVLTMHVPEMHCPFGCYPTVKETLEQQPGVSGVDLVEQSSDGAIDDPRVIVRLSDHFDAASAIGALADAGFVNSSVAPKK